MNRFFVRRIVMIENESVCRLLLVKNTNNGGAIRNVKYRLSFLLLRDSVTKQQRCQPYTCTRLARTPLLVFFTNE
jgi:hypothetical protein